MLNDLAIVTTALHLKDRQVEVSRTNSDWLLNFLCIVNLKKKRVVVIVSSFDLFCICLIGGFSLVLGF